uniref:Transposase Tc1-like domain-containing protein n=1 Tax=Sinocyclocheilus rhinocerous TaxID=307959 RepID=A0A673LFM0_9TELE
MTMKEQINCPLLRRKENDLKLPVNTVTIRSCLIEAKLSARSPCKAPLLKKCHVQNLLKFAKEHIDCKIVLFRTSGHRQYVI